MKYKRLEIQEDDKTTKIVWLNVNEIGYVKEGDSNDKSLIYMSNGAMFNINSNVDTLIKKIFLDEK